MELKAEIRRFYELLHDLGAWPENLTGEALEIWKRKKLSYMRTINHLTNQLNRRPV